MNDPVAAARLELDALDLEVLRLLARRQRCVRALFVEKDARGLPRIDPERERALLAQRRATAEALGLPASLAESVFRAVLEASHGLP